MKSLLWVFVSYHYTRFDTNGGSLRQRLLKQHHLSIKEYFYSEEMKKLQERGVDVSKVMPAIEMLFKTMQVVPDKQVAFGPPIDENKRATLKKMIDAIGLVSLLTERTKGTRPIEFGMQNGFVQPPVQE